MLREYEYRDPARQCRLDHGHSCEQRIELEHPEG